MSLKSLETAGGTPKLLRLARICRGASGGGPRINILYVLLQVVTANGSGAGAGLLE